MKHILAALATVALVAIATALNYQVMNSKQKIYQCNQMATANGRIDLPQQFALSIGSNFALIYSESLDLDLESDSEDKDKYIFASESGRNVGARLYAPVSMVSVDDKTQAQGKTIELVMPGEKNLNQYSCFSI